MSLLPEFEYKRPGGLEELLDLLSNYEGEAVILAGGTDLIPRMKMGLKKPGLVIDIKDIHGLNQVKDEEKRQPHYNLSFADPYFYQLL